MSIETSLTRRDFLGRAAGTAAVLALGDGVLEAAGALAERAPIPLPSPRQVRADFQRMVDFGPRLTGARAHTDFVDWLAREFVAAGCELRICAQYDTSRWLAQNYGLRVLEGAGAGAVKVASYFPRSKETPPQGVSGTLVYGGALPQPSINGADPDPLGAAIAAYPAAVRSWASALPGALGDVRGSIMVVDLPAPPPFTIGELLGGSLVHYQGQGETLADLAREDYKRLWTVPGLALPLDSFTAMGVAGVVFVPDASYAALKGCYAPFEWFNEDVPALYVDRDTGAKLREQAGARPRATLTLTATRKTVPAPTVTAVLPGASSETLILNSHTDGTGFVEENGPVGLVHLARYFGALPRARRLKRTLVFAAWPGHFSNDLPQLGGWLREHQDLAKRAAAGLTIEHLGCSEWNDTLSGYRPTGRAELMAVWTTQGRMFEVVRDAVVARDLPRTALLRPPAQFGVGGPLQAAGIPQLGAIAGPEYLLTVSPGNDMEKLDAALASRQIAWLADVATRLDGVPAAELRQGDPTLGQPTSTGNIVPSDARAKPVSCATAVGGDRCLARRSPIGPRNIGRIRLGYTRARLGRLPVKPRSRTRRAFRYCVKGARGRVTAVFSSRSKKGKVRLVTTTARRHGNRGVGVGMRAAGFRRAYPNRLEVTKGLYRARRGSRRLFGLRRGRVRFIAVADKGLLRKPRSLRRYLRLAGFR